MKDKELTEKVIGCAYRVHNVLGPGFLEKVYENALAIEVAKRGIQVKQQEAIKVFYDGIVVGDYIADLWIEDRLIVELKAVRQLTEQHEIQLVNYLTATQVEFGLLINFGQSVAVKRKYRRHKSPDTKE